MQGYKFLGIIKNNIFKTTRIIAPLFCAIFFITNSFAVTARQPIKNTSNKSNVAARSAVPRSQGTVARAAIQSAINTGTKVTTAAKNTLISDCQEKYNGCMDAFCMPDNANGGRCICSNDIFKLDEQLKQIDEIDDKSYQLATLGVQSIESGVDISAQKRSINNTRHNALLDKLSGSSLDIPEISIDTSGRGTEQYKLGHDACIERMPECSAQIETMMLMYNQQIKSDCRAYENSIKQRKIAAQAKLDTAHSSLRSAALTRVQNANKWDLGQCTIEFRKCMQSTAGCGTDFSDCANIIAMDNTNSATRSVKNRVASKTYKIGGTETNIEIAASTYDNLLSKKPLCESVTKQCERVASSVWETFLRESAPQIKNAELIAENKVRQSCISNISNCFRQACRDNIDPNDKDGSYDMCLTRPTTMLNVCKVPLNACGISTESAAAAESSDIWEFVLARLAAMRVDACTTEVKQCLQSNDRCGPDYTQCIGLDTDTIIRMCPYDKLVGCQSVYGETDIRGNATYDNIANMIQGIFINIDNNFLTACQNAADEAMIRVCGDTENCNNLILTDKTGANSLDYGICEFGIDEQGNMQIALDGCRKNTQQITDQELGRVEGSMTGELGPVKNFAAKMDGIIYWEGVGIQPDGHLMKADDYLASTDTTALSEPARKRVISEIDDLSVSINRIIETIESDPTVQYCMTGRQVQGMNQTLIGHPNAARFPNLTTQMRTIISNTALQQAKEYYFTKYDEISQQMLRDYGEIAERMAKIRGENAKDVRREAARKSCVSLADMSSIPKSPPPPPGWGGYFISALAIIAAVVVSVFTFGAGAPLNGVAFTSVPAASSSVVASAAGAAAVGATTSAATASVINAVGIAIATGVAVVGAAGIAGMVGGAVAGSQNKFGTAKTIVDVSERELSGRHELDQWNYKETIISVFNWDSLNCHRCIESTRCAKSKSPMFGDKYCKEWEPKQTKCDDIQF